MKKRTQSGFAIIESILLIVVLAAIVGVGYYVWHRHNQKTPAATTTAATSNYQSPSVTTPTAPAINNTSDLNSAMSALNQTDVNSNSTDSSQLTSQTSGF